MKNAFFRFALAALALLVSSCSMLQKKIDPNEYQSTGSGFRFKFAMTGEWYAGQGNKGLYMVGQKSSSDGTTKLAIVRHGPIWTGGGKPMTNREILDGFRKDLEKEAQGGRVSKVKSEFNQKKYKDADCIYFEQSGEDSPAQGPMSMNNDGLICLHPKHKYQFVWLAITERRPLGKPVSESFAEDKKRLFESLDFLD
ncbi:MAG: hypothetical protein JNL11_09485 [Bdellovibrionaceae bacterium]|nr:hypothetical protein [Pseudobdellovibrionaceae bacterium]